MQRRDFLKSTACAAVGLSAARAQNPVFTRSRPGDSSWPSIAQWKELGTKVHGRLSPVESPLAACRSDVQSPACQWALSHLGNPFYISDQPGLTQTSGWLNAWQSQPSAYVIAAETTEDVIAAVDFARNHRLRLVVKGGGHSYQGTSNSPDSLLIWTRKMQTIVLHDDFVPQGDERATSGVPAVRLGAGVLWMQAYDAVTTQGGRYVQGGGCTSVGVAGLVQSGGFGSFSKRFGTAAGGLLEAEIVTADGVPRIVNRFQNQDLFWALKGGGGGSFGVVTRVTLQTRSLPERFGAVFATITASSDEAFRELIARAIAFYAESLLNPGWGEQMSFGSGNRLKISMVFQGVNRQQAERLWEPFFDAVGKDNQLSFESEPRIIDMPAQRFWDAFYHLTHNAEFIQIDDRPEAPQGSFSWRGDLDQTGHFLHGYRSAWLPVSLMQPNAQPGLVEALFASSRLWSVSLHFNKGLGGGPAEEIARAQDTATNPAVLDAFALAIIAGGSGPAFPDLPAPARDDSKGPRDAKAIDQSMDKLLEVLKESQSTGSYVSESDFFESRWQNAFWGGHYTRLSAIKEHYDPAGLFFVRHGVGSERWSDDGFTRIR